MNRPLATALVALLITSTAVAGQAATTTLSATVDSKDGSLTRMGARRARGDARFAIVSQDGTATLMLTSNVLVVQLTDKALREVREGDSDKDDDSVLGAIFEGVVRASLESVLRRSLEVSLSDIRSADYRDGRLILIARDGTQLFTKLNVNDKPLLALFAPDDARALVRLLRHR